MAQSSTSGNLRNGLIDFVAGSLGGVAVVYVGQPLDTVKVKMQTFPHLYKNMFDCLKQTLRNDGVIRGLYAGTTPAIIANVAENSVLFAAYGYCQKFVCAVTETEKVEDLSTVGNASAGFLAAFFSSFTLCPTELIKCQLQAMREVNMAAAQTAVIKDGTSAPNSSVSGSTTPSQNGGASASSSPTPSPTPAKDSQAVSTTHGEQNNLENRKDVTESSRASTSNIKESTPEIPLPKTETKQVNIGPLQLTQQIFRQYGIQGLFRGLVPTIMREMPGYFFFFGGYEGTREVLRKPGQSKDDIGLVRTMIAGAVGGLVLWTIIFPTDVIKSRVQISNKKQKFLNVGYEIVKKEGVLALYNGLKPTLVRTIPATAALFVVYEYSKKLMHHSFGD